MKEISSSRIEKMIYVIRGFKVMLDSDLAELYGVETKALNRAVKRNIARFPEDFMFQLDSKEIEVLRYQFGAANFDSKRRFSPYVFTENGVAMLSGILNSERAINVNISIMRTFTKIRSVLHNDEVISKRIALLKDDELIGFSFGWQETPTTFFMAASLVLPEYRLMGFYSQMVKKVLEISKDKGFQSVSSFHIATNNPVIISKLKIGFTISGLQLDAVHGVLVRLIYHHDELLQSATRFRAGAMGEVTIRDMLTTPS